MMSNYFTSEPMRLGILSSPTTSPIREKGHHIPEEKLPKPKKQFLPLLQRRQPTGNSIDEIITDNPVGDGPRRGMGADPSGPGGALDGPLSPPIGSREEPLNIVILGASFAGISCAHHFLDHTIEQLGVINTGLNYRLVIVSPSTHLYWNIAAPRALVKGGLIKHEQTFIAIEPGFQRHRGLPFTFVQGRCEHLDVDNRTLNIECSNVESQKRASMLLPKRLSKDPLDLRSPASQLPRVSDIPYHALIICTGTSADSDLLSLHGPHTDTVNALNHFHTQAAQAKSIVICGGGCSGVEVAGQLATYLNYTRHFPFRQKSHSPKRITLISGCSRLLPDLSTKHSSQAETLLRKLGVNIKHNSRVTSTKEWFDQTGATKIFLDDDTQLIADLYISCTGVTPNSDFAPAHIKDEKGYILTHASTLRCCVAAGERLYSLGDVASYSQNYLHDVYAAVPVVMHNLLNDLLRYEVQRSGLEDGMKDRLAELVDLEYLQREKDSLLCPISRFGGTGAFLGTRMPKFLVHWLKGRDFRLRKAREAVEFGRDPYKMLGK